MSWKEVVMYGVITLGVVIAGATGVIPKESAGAAMTTLVAFVAGRRIPWKGDGKEE